MQNENNATGDVNANKDGQGQSQEPQNIGDAAQQQASSNIQQTATQQGQNVVQEAGKQVEIAGQATVQQVQNLGQAGVNQVQNLGQAGAAQVGNFVGQVLKSKEDLKNQPAVSKDEKIYAALAYLPFVALLSIVVKPDSAYVRLHARQGLLLSMIFFFVGFFAAIISLFPGIGGFLALLLSLVPLGCIIIGAYSLYLAAMGFWWKIPVLGSVSEIIPIEWMAKTSKENITGQMGVAKSDYDNREETLKQEKIENQAPQATSDVQTQGQSQPQQQNVPTQQSPADNQPKL